MDFRICTKVSLFQTALNSEYNQNAKGIGLNTAKATTFSVIKIIWATCYLAAQKPTGMMCVFASESQMKWSNKK